VDEQTTQDDAADESSAQGVGVGEGTVLTGCMAQEKDTPPQQSDLLLHLPEINACFNQDSVEAIHASLKELDNEWSQAALKLMNG